MLPTSAYYARRKTSASGGKQALNSHRHTHPFDKPFMKHLALWLLALACSYAQAQNAAPPAPQTDLPIAQLKLGKSHLRAQIAESDRERAIGLMSRTSLAKDEGMLFIFPERGVQCFWMRNTLIPLSAAFIADDGRIVNLADMQPLSDDAHCSNQPVRYVLEVQQGWFAQADIKANSKVKGEVFATQKQRHKP